MNRHPTLTVWTHCNSLSPSATSSKPSTVSLCVPSTNRSTKCSNSLIASSYYAVVTLCTTTQSAVYVTIWLHLVVRALKTSTPPTTSWRVSHQTSRTVFTLKKTRKTNSRSFMVSDKWIRNEARNVRSRTSVIWPHSISRSRFQ
eukprot:PhF_6_TR12568/c1_g1_i1/m.19708